MKPAMGEVAAEDFVLVCIKFAPQASKKYTQVLYVCMYVCMYVCVSIYVRMCMNIYFCMHYVCMYVCMN